MRTSEWWHGAGVTVAEYRCRQTTDDDSWYSWSGDHSWMTSRIGYAGSWWHNGSPFVVILNRDSVDLYDCSLDVARTGCLQVDDAALELEQSFAFD